MKITGNFEEWTVTQTQLAKILGLTVGRINQLIDEKIVERDESTKTGEVFLIESVKNYYESKNFYKDKKGDKVNFWEERGLHERAKRQMAELKLSKMRGEVYEAKTVDEAFRKLVMILRDNLLALPSKYAPQLEGKKPEQIYEILFEEIESNLAELSQFDVKTLAEDVIADDDDD